MTATWFIQYTFSEVKVERMSRSLPQNGPFCNSPSDFQCFLLKLLLLLLKYYTNIKTPMAFMELDWIVCVGRNYNYA